MLEGLQEAIEYARDIRDRCRTTNNLLGDCYCAAVVEALSKNELTRMDEERAVSKKEEEEEDEEDDYDEEEANHPGSQSRMKNTWSQVTKVRFIKVYSLN